MNTQAFRPARAAWAATALARLPVDAHPIVSSPKAAAALIAVATTRSLNDSDGWREPGVARKRRLAVERQPFAVTPQGRRPRRDDIARGKFSRGIGHGIER